VYNAGILFFDTIIVRLLSLALIGAVFFHAFNGVRIILIDFWKKGVKYQAAMFGVVLVLTILAFLPVGWTVVLPIINGTAKWFVDPFLSMAH
jgi:succinate dehydrogenase / fumarate reductase cytochrome b subunit